MRSDAGTKKAREVEYRILITPQFDELRQKHTTLFLLETTKSFASFRYELSVQEQTEGKTIRYKVLGLKAPQLSLPESGHAQYTREYENLKGTYTVTVEGLDKRESTFAVRISLASVRITKPPTGALVEAFDDKKLWMAHS